jgi:hypothetical protein
MKPDHPPERTKRALIVVAAFLGIGAIAGSYWLVGSEDSRWTPANIDQSKAAADTIINAIRAFHMDRGAFPATLEDLVPNYLMAIVPPSAGNPRWQYRVERDGRGFILLLGANKGNYPNRYYSSKADSWSMDE